MLKKHRHLVGRKSYKRNLMVETILLLVCTTRHLPGSECLAKINCAAEAPAICGGSCLLRFCCWSSGLGLGVCGACSLFGVVFFEKVNNDNITRQLAGIDYTSYEN